MLQFTQQEWAQNQYTDNYSRGAWEFRGRDYPEEWIGRRNTFEPYSTVLIAEGVGFEIIGENEWEEASICIPFDGLVFESGDENVVSVYLETWFDVDQKFGTHTHDEPDTWINLYAQLNLSENSLVMQYIIKRPDSEETVDYIPTTKERDLVIRLIRQSLGSAS